MKYRGYCVSISEKEDVIENLSFMEENKISHRTKYHHISDSIVEYETFDGGGRKTSYGKVITKGLFSSENICTYIRINSDEITHRTLCEYDENRNILYEQTSYDKDERIVSYKWYDYLEFDKKTTGSKE